MATSFDNSSHRVNGIPALQWLEVWIQFLHSSQVASPYCFQSCTNGTHQISQNSMNSMRVGSDLMVSLWILSYCMKQGGYSIGFLARQYWCSDPRRWDSDSLHATSVQVSIAFHMSSRCGQSWTSVPLWACDHQDWFEGWCKRWMPLRWSCLYLWKAAGHWILSAQWIPLPFFTDYAGKVVLSHIHTLVKGIPPQNRQLYPHYNIPSQQYTYHCCCHRGESLAKTHFIRQHCSWHIRIPNPPPHNEPYGQNLVHQKPCSGRAWHTVICWLVNLIGVQQPDCLIKTHAFKFRCRL